jgi:archaellum component FlaC
MPRRPDFAVLVALSLIALPAVGTTALTGCAKTKIWMNEKLGYEKREQLVGSVEKARDQQEKAKVAFASALEEFLAITEGDESTADLEKKYKKIESAYENSASRAEAVHGRIASVETVAKALFKEWEKELGQYSSDSLRAASQEQLDATRERYTKLVGAMKDAAAKMDPVLAAFKDQTLFLKHNLNARAIASLETDLAKVKTEVAELIQEMEASIAEANAFIDSLQE